MFNVYQRLMILFLAILSPAFSVAKPIIQESISYSLDWWVDPTGEVSKIYEISYQGEQIQKKLKTFAGSKGVKSYIIKTLADIENTDELIKTEKKSEFDYVFIFKGKKQFVGSSAKFALPLNIPVYEDPVANYIQPVKSSHIHYKTIPLIIKNRIAYRTPWVFEYSRVKEIPDLSGKNVNVHCDFRLLTESDNKFPNLPGFDQKGAEYTQTIVSNEDDISIEEQNKFNMLFEKWNQFRNEPAAIFKIPETTSGHPDVPEYQWGGAINLLGGRLVTNQTESIFGYDVSLEMFKFRQWSKNFGWRAFDIKLTSGSGHGQYSSWFMSSISLGTGLLYRFPYVTKAPDRVFSFIDLIITPSYGIYQNNFFGSVAIVNSPAVETRIRIGTSPLHLDYIAQFSMDLFVTSYLSSQMLSNDAGLNLVISW